MQRDLTLRACPKKGLPLSGEARNSLKMTRIQRVRPLFGQALSSNSPKDSSAIIEGDRSEGWLAIVIGILLGCCILGLMHSIETIGQDEVDSVEAGGGIEVQEAFEANVNSASIQKKNLGLSVWA